MCQWSHPLLLHPTEKYGNWVMPLQLFLCFLPFPPFKKGRKKEVGLALMEYFYVIASGIKKTLHQSFSCSFQQREKNAFHITGSSAHHTCHFYQCRKAPKKPFASLAAMQKAPSKLEEVGATIPPFWRLPSSLPLSLKGRKRGHGMELCQQCLRECSMVPCSSEVHLLLLPLLQKGGKECGHHIGVEPHQQNWCQGELLPHLVHHSQLHHEFLFDIFYNLVAVPSLSSRSFFPLDSWQTEHFSLPHYSCSLEQPVK